MFDSLKPGKMQIFVDPPPRGFFTYEDIVSGKAVFDTTRDFQLGFVIVTFHGWVNTKVVKNTQWNGSQGPAQTEEIDKDILFQETIKVYPGGGKFPKGTHFEWPFSFSFYHPNISDPKGLPTSGRYHLCSVEYKVIAEIAPANIDETLFMRMRNPDDTLFQKNSPINLDKMRVSIEKHLGSGAEQELQFIQIRRSSQVGNEMAGPFHANLDIPGESLPNIRYVPAPLERHGLFNHSQPGIPFTVNLDIPKNIVEGLPFPAYISVVSPNEDWTIDPPLVELISLKIKLLVRTISRAGMNGKTEDHRNELIFDGQNLAIQLGPQPLDLGKLLTLVIKGSPGAPAIVSSFNTRLLETIYALPTECKIGVAGKTFKCEFPIEKHLANNIEIISRIAPLGNAAHRVLPHSTKEVPFDFPGEQDLGMAEMKKIRLQHTYVGHLSQYGNAPLRPDSIMEGALALAREMTACSIHLEFTGGSAFKLLPYTPPRGSQLNDKNYDQRQDDRVVLKEFLGEHFTLVSARDFFDIDAQYTDPIHGEKISFYIPQVTGFQVNDHWQHKWLKENRDRTDEVSLDPVTLLNYRLNCALTRNLEVHEVDDFRILYTAFERHLHRHRTLIDINTARIAAQKYPVLRQILGNLELEVGVVQQESLARPLVSDEEVRSYSSQPQPASENFGDQKSEASKGGTEGLVKGFKNLLHKHHK